MSGMAVKRSSRDRNKTGEVGFMEGLLMIRLFCRLIQGQFSGEADVSAPGLFRFSAKLPESGRPLRSKTRRTALEQLKVIT
jgi:hypothetical protein